jgi:hypothetical protein
MQLWNILHIEYCFYCEPQRVNQNNPIIDSFVHLQHVIISIFMKLFSNTTELGLVHVYKKINEECRCRVPSKGWILGIF